MTRYGLFFGDNQFSPADEAVNMGLVVGRCHFDVEPALKHAGQPARFAHWLDNCYLRSDMAKHGDGTRRNVTNQAITNWAEMKKMCKIVALKYPPLIKTVRLATWRRTTVDCSAANTVGSSRTSSRTR